jgi:hypothetical protein
MEQNVGVGRGLGMSIAPNARGALTVGYRHENFVLYSFSILSLTLLAIH